MKKEIKEMSGTQMRNLCAKSKSLPMEAKYRNKEVCKNTAAHLIDIHEVTGMTQAQIQEEIFAHAVAYYDYATLATFLGLQAGIIGTVAATAVSLWLRDHCTKIDIEDGGETRPGFQTAYKLIWNAWPSTF